MRLLLDTHAFLWWISADDRLSANARDVISDGTNDVWFSAASGWEIVVKSSLGRLTVDRPLDELVPEQLEANAFQVLPIHLRHVLAIDELPDLHRDPFDRVLVAQALVEDLALVTGDPVIARYPATVVW